MHHLVDYRAPQLRFVGEMMVEGALGHACLGENHIQARPLEAVPVNLVKRRLEQLLSSNVRLPPSSAGFRHVPLSLLRSPRHLGTSDRCRHPVTNDRSLQTIWYVTFLLPGGNLLDGIGF